jgi:hypothetical protein
MRIVRVRIDPQSLFRSEVLPVCRQLRGRLRGRFVLYRVIIFVTVIAAFAASAFA